jgi:putative PIN family toxin of toxin-antitoxin system
MKAVLDTNVIVSGALSRDGTCARLLHLLVDDAFDLYADERVLAEYEEVLPRPELGIRPSDARAAMEIIREKAVLVAPLPLGEAMEDTDDAPFLEVAAAAKAVLVTGNLRHFPPRVRCGVAVMTPREFLAALGGE